MSRLALVMLSLLASLLACSLTSSDADPTALPLNIATQTPALSLTPTLNITPSPTARLNQTPTQSSVSNQQPAALPPTVTNCTPRADWTTLYTVTVGDTLGGIAQAVGSSVNDLSQGNCLANPNSIAVGLQLRVPRAPATTSSGSNTTSTGNNTTSGNNTASSGNNTTSSGNNTTSSGSNTTGNNTTSSGGNAPSFNKALSANPVSSQSGVGIVSFQQTIALDAGIANDADKVEFYAGLTQDDAAPVLIGTDIDPFDGAQITYDFNDFDSKLFFWAVASNEFGSTKSLVLAVTYSPASSNVPLSIAPYSGFDGSFYTLDYGATVTIAWSSVPSGAVRVDFYYTPTGEASVLLGSDSTPGDGAALGWTVPQWILGQVSARAVFSNGTGVDSSVMGVYSEGEGVRPS